MTTLDAGTIARHLTELRDARKEHLRTLYEAEMLWQDWILEAALASNGYPDERRMDETRDAHQAAHEKIAGTRDTMAAKYDECLDLGIKQPFDFSYSVQVAG